MRCDVMRQSSVSLLVCSLAIYLAAVPGSTIQISGGLQGVPTSCSQEGEVLSLPDATDGQMTHDPCIHCVCKNSAVVCEKEECEGLETCPVVERRTPEGEGECCARCKGCFYAGQNYTNDQHWLSNQDACRTLTCKGGVVTMARMHCVTPCSNPIRRSGYCCPLCPISHSNSVILGGPEMAVLTDPCLRCQCDSWFCHCYRTACPALDCPGGVQYTPRGHCCPECHYPTKEIRLDAGRCVYKNEKFEHQQSFRPDPCTLCKCQDSSVICQRFVCPRVHCSKERLYYDPQLCCPRCRDRDPLPCTYLDQHHQHATVWRLDECTTCKCTNGETKCVTEPCQYAHGCPVGYRLKKIPGQCCPECEEKEAICTVFGDPHYQTFDKKQYSFQGTCKYVLSQPCIVEDGSSEVPFIVVAQNDPMKSVGYSWTKHISVQLPREKLRISLLRGKRVKENGRRLRLPHLRLGVYSVMMDKERRVVLRVSSVGLKVVWGQQSYVEVGVSSKYKGRLCGLCGNYNHDVSDDFTTSDGHMTSSVETFAQSWKFGSWKKCRSETDRIYQRLAGKERRKLRRQKENDLKIRSEDVWRMIFGKRSKNPLISPASEEAVIVENRKANGNRKQQLWRKKDTNAKNERKSDYSLDIVKGEKEKEKWRKGTEKKKRQRKKERRRRRLSNLCRGGRKKWRDRRAQIKECRLLKKDLFRGCRGQVPVGKFYRWCVEDACACPSSGKCHCESLTAYSRQCEEEAGILVKWKHLSSCQFTSACSVKGAVFSSCAPGCQPTCGAVRRGDSGCTGETCTPGCTCPPGTVLHGKECIPTEKCP